MFSCLTFLVSRARSESAYCSCFSNLYSRSRTYSVRIIVAGSLNSVEEATFIYYFAIAKSSSKDFFAVYKSSILPLRFSACFSSRDIFLSFLSNCFCISCFPTSSFSRSFCISYCSSSYSFRSSSIFSVPSCPLCILSLSTLLCIVFISAVMEFFKVSISLELRSKVISKLIFASLVSASSFCRFRMVDSEAWDAISVLTATVSASSVFFTRAYFFTYSDLPKASLRSAMTASVFCL